jgi:hypothetical protein
VIHPDSLGEGREVRRGVKPDPVTLGLEGGGEDCGRGAFALGPGDEDGGKGFLRISQGGEEVPEAKEV